jgi:hypothetical protein
MPVLIGLCGKALSGKDTVGNYLHDRYDFYRTAIAAYPKRVLKNLYDLSYEQLWGDQKEVVDPRYGFSPRYIMQFWLNDCCKHIDPNIWIRICQQTVNAALATRSVVVTDVRFQDEAQMIRNLNGYLIKIFRDGAQASQGIKNHISEHDLDNWADWDLVLNNNDTLDDLYIKVDNFIRSVHDHGRESKAS